MPKPTSAAEAAPGLRVVLVTIHVALRRAIGLALDVAPRLKAGVVWVNSANQFDAACGFGGFAEYVCAREEALAPKPASLSFAQAAAVPMAAVTALQGLRDKGRVQAGDVLAIVKPHA